jgi:photosystem II stability/assembly factor-like uncharacterized protein
MKKNLTFAILMLLPLSGMAQWHLLRDFDSYLPADIRSNVQLTSIYFLDLPGPPRIGFVGMDHNNVDSNQVWKTTDGGWTWYSVKAPYHPDPVFIGLNADDFAFKDSSTGWLANFWAWGGCDVTTDAGETWTIVPMPNPSNPCYLLYYHHATNRLFAALEADNWSLVSTDEGTTWQSMNLYFVGISFSDDSTGILLGGAYSLAPPTIYYTTNGGVTWTLSSSSVPPGCVHPLAIKGTKTFFIEDVGCAVSRSDNGGQTWRELSVVPSLHITLGEGTGVLFGNLQNIYTQTDAGIFVSKDSGITWQSLCGPGNSLDGGEFTKSFYERDGRIYAGEFNDITQGRLWYLNTDSLNIFSSSLHLTQSTSSVSSLSVLFHPQIDSTVRVDTAHFAIRYDTSLLLKSLQLPAGWNILDSSLNGNTINITIFDTLSIIDTPSVTLNFEPILTPSQIFGTVWLDSTNLYGKWMNCDISAHSTSAPDSVQINFNACGDSLLLAAMSDKPLFTIESIQPNPAQNEITVQLSGNVQPVIEMYDALGREQDVRSTSLQSGITLDVSKLPSGIYFLRVSADGYVVSRCVVVEH